MKSSTTNKIIVAFVVLSAAITASVQFLQGNFKLYTPVVPLVIILVGAFAAHFYTNKALNMEINPLMWLLTAPLFFAVAGFSIWAGCMLAVHILNNAVQAAPSVNFFELLSGIVSRGSNFAITGLTIGLAWAIPTSLTLFIMKLVERPTKPLQTVSFHSEMVRDAA
jgi:hypothetical protein